MPLFLDTRGHSTLGIGICARCACKRPLDELFPDPNANGLMVCLEDRDVLDPYRLPSREPDRITLDHPRPDVSLSIPTVDPIYVGALQAVLGVVPQTPNYPSQPLGAGASSGEVIAEAPPANVIQPPVPWAANTAYITGAQVTSIPFVGFAAAGVDIYLFNCLVPGLSGQFPPNWPDFTGVPVRDNQVTWINAGIYLG